MGEASQKERRIPTGADAFVHGLIGKWRRRKGVLRSYLAQARRVTEVGGTIAEMRENALREQLRAMREHYARDRNPDQETRIRALALLREAARRTLHLQPFEVQIAGALVLDDGMLAEMATGEGKTLTSGLAAILGAWRRVPVHVITVNDYLVQRDCEWLGRLYRYCGIEARSVVGGMPEAERRLAYAAPITYGTSKEIAADFLRDRIANPGMDDAVRRKLRTLFGTGGRSGSEPLMRGLHRAIVDEADSLLIDEAVTPLILSRKVPNPGLASAVRTAAGIACDFVEERDYRTIPRYREVELTDLGKALLADLGGSLSGIWSSADRREEIVRQALVAREFHRKGEHYIVEDGKIVIVDEFTGRPMPDRSWRRGLHQAVEAKEGVDLTDPTETLARISFQRFFRKYPHLSGMTGTAWEAGRELWRVYNLAVIRIPTHRPCRRTQLKDRYFPTEAAKFTAIIEEVADLNRRGLPVLVGTRTVQSSERLHGDLLARGLTSHLLNARQTRAEAEVIAMAGLPGRITIATNMAGRGTDIRLAEGVAEAGGLHVLAAERHESARIDRQLFGRAGRQGDPGAVRQYASAEDGLLQKYIGGFRRHVLSSWIRLAPGKDGWFAGAAFRKAQRVAQRQFLRQRRRIQEQDERLDEGLSFGRDARHG